MQIALSGVKIEQQKHLKYMVSIEGNMGTKGSRTTLGRSSLTTLGVKGSPIGQREEEGQDTGNAWRVALRGWWGYFG